MKITSKPQNNANVYTGGTGDTQVAKKATEVVLVVNSIAPAASGKANSAISSVETEGFSRRAFFHFYHNKGLVCLDESPVNL